MIRHPVRQGSTRPSQCHSIATAGPPEFDAEFVLQQATQGQAQCQAFGVSLVVIANAVPERLRARGTAPEGGVFGAILVYKRGRASNRVQPSTGTPGGTVRKSHP